MIRLLLILLLFATQVQPATYPDAENRITPVIKQSIVVEFGDAELEFRAGVNSIDIKIEESGDLIFFARNIDKSFVKKLCELI